MVTVGRKFLSFHQNDDIVHSRLVTVTTSFRLTSITHQKRISKDRKESAVEANTSSVAGTSPEKRISLSFQRWNIFIITRGIVL